MLAALLIVALAQVDGGVLAAEIGTPEARPLEIFDVVSGDLLVREPDGGVSALVAVEGCYLATDDCVRLAKQKASKRAENEVLRDPSEWVKWIAISFAGGAAVGLAVGIAVGRTGQH